MSAPSSFKLDIILLAVLLLTSNLSAICDKEIHLPFSIISRRYSIFCFLSKNFIFRYFWLAIDTGSFVFLSPSVFSTMDFIKKTNVPVSVGLACVQRVYTRNFYLLITPHSFFFGFIFIHL